MHFTKTIDDDTTHLYLKSINGDKKLSEKKKFKAHKRS